MWYVPRPWGRYNNWFEFHAGFGSDEDCNRSVYVDVGILGGFVWFYERPLRKPGSLMCDDCIRELLAGGARPEQIVDSGDAHPRDVARIIEDWDGRPVAVPPGQACGDCGRPVFGNIACEPCVRAAMMRANPRNIHDLVGEWHDCEGLDGVPLHVYLGLTWDEYKAWVERSVLPPDCGLYDNGGER